MERLGSCRATTRLPSSLLLRLLSTLITILGGSWVVRSGVISHLSRVVSIVTLLITLLITTHEPPSMSCILGFRV